MSSKSFWSVVFVIGKTKIENSRKYVVVVLTSDGSAKPSEVLYITKPRLYVSSKRI
jgi:hypothetical protein